MTLSTLPTLDGSVAAAVARLEAWASDSLRKRMAADQPRFQTVGERTDQLSLLEVDW